MEGGISTSATILSKLLKINISGELAHSGNSGENESVEKEKVHTSVSLLSKFRSYLISEKMLNSDFDVSKMQIGSFVEIEGELQKNPLINYMDIFVDVFRMAEIFTEKPQLGGKNQARNQKQQEDEIVRQIKSFSEELKHTGTVDFILTDKKGIVVLSAQEQYLANDNISEIIGGRFKVLGKVIAICKDETESVDLLRKTTLLVLSERMLSEMFSGFNTNICELIKVDDELERSFYEKETVKEKWDVRTLRRQMESALFLRLAVSRDKESILALAQNGIEIHRIGEGFYFCQTTISAYD